MLSNTHQMCSTIPRGDEFTLHNVADDQTILSFSFTASLRMAEEQAGESDSCRPPNSTEKNRSILSDLKKVATKSFRRVPYRQLYETANGAEDRRTR